MGGEIKYNQQGVMQSYDKCVMKYCIMKEKMLWFNSG